MSTGLDTARLRKPANCPRGDGRLAARNTSGGAGRHTSTSWGDHSPLGSANRRRRRTYRGTESGQQRHAAALTPFREQTTTLEVTALPYCRSGLLPRMRAQAPPLRVLACARGTLGAGVFPLLSTVTETGRLANRRVAEEQPPAAAASPPACSTLDPSPSQPLHSHSCTGQKTWGSTLMIHLITPHNESIPLALFANT